MTYSNRNKSRPPVDRYPYSIIIPRWLFAVAEMGLASYFVFSLKFELGIIFLAYGVVCAFLLLPLIRCVRCYYYGRRCNFGWGILVSRLLPKVEGENYASRYGYSILFWPLRIIPFGLGLRDIIFGFIAGFQFLPQGIFGIYFLVIFLHRQFYRKLACSRCHQRPGCPVYDAKAVMENTLKVNTVSDTEEI